jgi:hypothetical protein
MTSKATSRLSTAAVPVAVTEVTDTGLLQFERADECLR